VYWAEVNWDLCQSCNPCRARLICNVRAIVKLSADEAAFIDQGRCHGCGKCLPACSFAAILLRNQKGEVSVFKTDPGPVGEIK
jgi:Fe-S-cluster-containing hydrogenase component 2